MVERPRPVEPYQTQVTSGCGPSVALMVLRAYGMRSTEQILANEMRTTAENGTNIEELRKCLWRRKFKTYERCFADWDDLYKARNTTDAPIIIEWYDDRDYDFHELPTDNPDPCSHYSLVKSMTAFTITLCDPAFGKDLTFSRDWWEKRWTGRSDSDNDPGWFMVVDR